MRFIARLLVASAGLILTATVARAGIGDWSATHPFGLGIPCCLLSFVLSPLLLMLLFCVMYRRRTSPKTRAENARDDA
jgi:hypothetical protein